MSHQHQRKEKDCLNCGTIVQGKYCHNCGQANVEPKESFGHMVFHFFNDITHFDGSFFTTAKDLLFKPGFLSKEYMAGRRVRYLHPIRMYVFTSAIFFLLFFSFFVSGNSIVTAADVPLTVTERQHYVEKLKEQLKKDTGNTAIKAKLLVALDTSKHLTVGDLLENTNAENVQIGITNSNYKSMSEYDSAQKTLKADERDGWFMRRLTMIDIRMNQKLSSNPKEALKKFTDIVLHRLPYMLLISLPFFALILKLVYWRRKQFYYADHGVFAIHFYVFSFILLLLVFTFKKAETALHWSFAGTLANSLFFLLLFYMYMAMLRFYGQGKLKTFFKFLIVALSALVMMLLIFIVIIFFTAATF